MYVKISQFKPVRGKTETTIKQVSICCGIFYYYFVYTLYIFQAFCMIVHLIVIIIASL